jgi:hypothetical protein
MSDDARMGPSDDAILQITSNAGRISCDTMEIYPKSQRRRDISETSLTEVNSFYGAQQSRCSLLSPEDGNTSSFRNVCFLAFRIPNDGHSPETQ